MFSWAGFGGCVMSFPWILGGLGGLWASRLLGVGFRGVVGFAVF